jgi:hypothetical protein
MSDTTPNETFGSTTQPDVVYSSGKSRRTYDAPNGDDHPVEERVVRTVVSRNADGTLRYYAVRLNVAEDARRREIAALNSELR